MKSHRLPDILLPAVLLLAFLAYYQGTSGYFQFDDTVNIVNNARLQIQSLDFSALLSAAFSGDAGLFSRPISVLSFAFNYYFSDGLNPMHMKLTNVVIHLFNGIAIYVLSQLLLHARNRHSNNQLSQSAIKWIGLAVAAGWLMHPLNLSGVLYIVQRMTSLASLFMFLGLAAYIHGRLKNLNGQSGWLWILSTFVIFTPLATFSKENGALLPLFALLTEVVFFRFESSDIASKRGLIALYVVCVLAPFGFAVIYTINHPGWIFGAYSIRDFTLAERCMTETRVLWLYLRLIIAPDIFVFGMHHDDIVISKGLLEPGTTILAIGGLIALASLAVACLKRHPVMAYGILLFLLGHSMESSFIPLEIAHEHRNYLPSFGPLFVLFYYLLHPLHHVQSRRVRHAFGALCILIFAGLTVQRSIEWGDPVQLKEKEAMRHPLSVRANLDIAYFYMHMPAASPIEAEEFYRDAYRHFAAAAEISPSDTLGLLGLINLQLRHSLPLEESWMPVLAKRIEAAPFSSSTANSIVDLNKCFLNKSCNPSPEVVETLIQAALRNPTLAGKPKARILLSWSYFLLQAKQQPNEAVKVAYQAIDANPGNLDIHTDFIAVLIGAGKPDEALVRIEIARKLDQLKTHSQNLNALQEKAKTARDRAK